MIYSYGRPTGFVQDVISLPAGAYGTPIFYGVSDSNTITENQIVTSNRVLDINSTRAQFTFPETTNQYLFVAIPTSFGTFDTIRIGNFDVSMVKNTVMLTVNNVSFEYVVHVSTYAQNGDNIVASILR